MKLDETERQLKKQRSGNMAPRMSRRRGHLPPFTHPELGNRIVKQLLESVP